MNTPERSWDEVESLLVGIRRALNELRRYRPFLCLEPGVAYRFDSLIGIMEIMANDAQQMEQSWRADEQTQKDAPGVLSKAEAVAAAEDYIQYRQEQYEPSIRDTEAGGSMTWEQLPAWQGPIHQGSLSCPPVEKVAPMDMVIGVGFGVAMVTKDGRPVYQERYDMDEDDFWTTANAEREAAADSDHDWRILLEAPLRSREYQRHGPDQWVLIASGPGFA